MEPQKRSSKPRPTFKVALALSSVMGFAQLMAVGVALTMRQPGEESRQYASKPEVVVLKEVQEVPVNVIAEIPKQLDAASIVNRVVPKGHKVTPRSRKHEGIASGGEVNILTPEKVEVNYVVKHPKVESLLKEAHTYYVRGDMGNAVILLEEAKALDALEPAVIDMEAQIAEDMGALKAATDLYLKNFQIGLSAGSYYRRAAYKLEKGVGRKMDDWSTLMFGKVSIERSPSGRSTEVVIPVRSKEGETILSDLVEVKIHLYDLVNGEKIQPAAKNSSIDSSWLDNMVNWEGSGEESIRVVYNIPMADEVERHLYGSRTYYGQVIELIYKGVLEDVVAHPGTLVWEHAKINYQPAQQFPSLDFLDNFNEYNPLLPELEPEMDFELPR